MGTPRARKNVGTVSARSAGVSKTTARRRPVRPDSMLHPVDDKGLPLPVRPDTRAPVRPISVRSRVTIGAKSI